MKLRDPEGFAAQELRRKHYVDMKNNCKIQKASVALPVLQCQMFLDSENELFYDDPYDADDPAIFWLLGQGGERPALQIAAAAVPTCQQRGIIITGDAVAELVRNATFISENKASASKVLGTGVDTLFIELCAS